MKKKIIILNNQNDVEEFYKKISIYKIFFYKNTLFELKNNIKDNQCEDIIKALNIKNKKQRINFVYDKACEQIDNHNKEQNVSCEFKNGKCLHQHNSNRFNGCCSLCRYQSDKGCVTQNISCKLFFCDSLCKKYNILKIKDLKILNCLSLRNRIIIKNNFFIEKETFLKELYINSLIIFGFLSIKSNIKNNIYMYRKNKKVK